MGRTKDTFRGERDIGDFFPFFGSTIPSGHLFCDGRTLSITDPLYVALFNKIQYRFGGSIGVNFKLPDTRGCLLDGSAMGASTGATYNTSSQTFGIPVFTSQQSITLANAPSHSHPQSMSHSHGGSFSNSHNHNLTHVSIQTTDGSIKDNATGVVVQGINDSVFNTDSTYDTSGTAAISTNTTGVTFGYVSGHGYGAGSNAAHNNMMAWLAVPFIIKYAY